MENHPIPQDVSSFQFKLIGNMTVKQFAYLATGVVLAIILFQLPVNFLLKFPFCAFFAALGILLAYVPISGRPMDLMIGNYFRALINPTVFVYDRTDDQPYSLDDSKKPASTTKGLEGLRQALNPMPKDELKAYLQTRKTEPEIKLDEMESNFLTSVSALSSGDFPHRQHKTSDPGLPQINPQLDLAQQGYASQTPLTQEKIIANITQPLKMSVAKTGTISSPQASTTPTSAINLKRPSPRGWNRNADLTTPSDFPNMITGCTKDPRGNALTGILIEIKDKDGNPVRAFKTNEVGRFASATPLANGTYMVEFEDPRNQNLFKTISINASGQTMPSIEVISIDKREELRKSLFETNRHVN